MSTPMELLVDQIAEAVAHRVLARLRAEAARKKAVLLTPEEMAARMGVSIKTLANWRSKDTGPKFVKRGSSVRYPVTPDDAT